jgi:hypothetical protein
MPAGLATFLLYGAIVSAAMAVIWAFRLKKWGIRALPMLIAFIVFGALMLVWRNEAPLPFVLGLGLVLGVMLWLDVMFRVAWRREAQR